MSPRKMRVVANLVRGKSVEEAVGLSTSCRRRQRGSSPRRSRAPRRTPRTSRAATSSVEDLRIHTIAVDGGTIAKRWMPRSMGRANRINHRTSHLTVVVTDEK